MFLVLICLFKPHFLKPGPKKNTVVDFWRMIWQEEVTFYRNADQPQGR